MEGFSFVTQVTGLNRPNTGKEDDDDDDDNVVKQVGLKPSQRIEFIFSYNL
jgi:hypothetical protein